MKKKEDSINIKVLSFTTLTLLTSVFMLCFILDENDHKTYGQEQITEMKQNGSQKTKKHICKEKYNF